jgi:hypothetical protein
VIAFVQNQLGTIEERQEWTPEVSAEDVKTETVEEKTEEKSLLGSILDKFK